MGFIRRLMKPEIQVSPGSFSGGEHAHKTRLACLQSRINGVAGAEIV